jgi:hypothetical protein
MRLVDVVIEKMFQIANKQAMTVDFTLNKVQRKYSSMATSRDIILKARREGFSSYLRAEYLTACITEDNTRAVILSQDTAATMKHLEVVKFHCKHMKGGKPQLGYNSKLEMSFPKRDSTFYIGTAGSKEWGRGDTITHLHLSEAAFFPDLKALQASIMQAASFAKRISIESTANGFNHFQVLCEKARRGEGEYTLHFYPWFVDEDNMMMLFQGEKLPLWDSDIILQKAFDLSNEQMKWYITKRKEFMDDENDLEGLNKFHQEYPSTIEEAFVSSGTTFFRLIPYEPLMVDPVGHTLYYRRPVEGHKYVIGGDYSGGIGQDYGVLQVIDVTTMEQVAVYRDNWTDPEMLSIKAVALGREYNTAYIIPEANNHGILGIDVLKRSYPIGRIFKREVPENKKPTNKGSKKALLGYLTTEKSKAYACGALRLYLKRGLKIHDKETYHELQMFSEIEGRLSAPEGEHDDCVMGMAMASVSIKEIVKKLPEEEPAKKSKLDYTKPIMPFATMDDLFEIVKNTEKGRSMIADFYLPSEANKLLAEMKRLAHG